MKRTHLYQSILAAALSAAMVFGSLGSAFAAQDTNAAEEPAVSVNTVLQEKLENARNSGLGTEKLSGSRTDISDLTAEEIVELAEAQENIAKLTDNADETVRVSIVVEGEPTTALFGTADIASNAQAMAYRAQLESKQAEVTAAIEAEVLGGAALDVRWNLTLAANAISANVTYGQIPAILKVDGVKKVVVETKYSPAVYSTDSADPEMATSGEMIGSGAAWANGYTGAGSRVAIIDTGLDLDHEMVDADAFEFSLAVKAAVNKQKAAAYIESLDLLDEDEIDGVFEQLNAQVNAEVAAEDLYNTSKVPYVFNYIDQNTNGTHDYDSQGDHGSHVSGIAAANKYVKNASGKYVASLTSTFVQGVAPDAQILVMKVFGEGGGAYDSDYMAAIEDALILRADSVNLSLGSAAPGFSVDFDGDSEYAAEGLNAYGNDYFLDILDSLEDSDTVVSISAGNAYSYAYNSTYGYLYAEDVNFDTVGSPGSYTNALTVASANNTGTTGYAMTASDGSAIFYTETDGYGNAPLTSLASETPYTYIAIDGVGTDAQWAALKDVLPGNIAVCSRGTTSFYEKANAAVANGAVATLIYNNTSGTISMNLTGYSYSAPAVSLTQADGALLKALGEQKTITVDGADVSYYEGTITITDTVSILPGEEDAVVGMSNFSSFGVPSSLELKPEITAPGGNIYSLKDGNGYQNMSGTSMAAPQVTGMAAVVAQYIKDNNLDEKTGLTVRQLSQSLLMATAEPIIDDEWFGYYYPVFRQGAGLANVGNAVSAKAYILMDEDATISASDGKVKAELGDDPERTGVYTYAFTINNLSDTEQEYELFTIMFEQVEYPLYARYGISDAFLVDGAYGMDATAEYEGEAVDDSGIVTVPASGSASVTVTITLSDDEKEYIDETYPNGTYVEGYTFITPVGDEVSDEGEILADTVEYSIPILGFYGNWSDASAFDSESFETYLYGAEHWYKDPYTLDGFASLAARYGDMYKYYTNLVEMVDADYAELLIAYGLEDYLPSFAYVYTVNPWYIETAEDEDGELVPTLPDPARKAVKSGEFILDFDTRDIRNSGAFAGIITDEDGNVTLTDLQINHYPVFYYNNYGVWVEMGADGLYYFGADPANYWATASDLGFEEGDTFSISAVSIPEYYTRDLEEVTADAALDIIESGVLGKGSYLSHTFTVDDTAPEFITSYAEDDYEDKFLSAAECDNANNLLKFTVKDNEYVAVVRVFDFMTDEEIAEFTPAQTEAGEEIQVSVDMSEFPDTSIAYIMVGDYAGNYDTAFMTYGTYLYLGTDGNGTLSASYTVDGEETEIAIPDGEDYVLANLNIAESVEVTFTLTPNEFYSADYAVYAKYTETFDLGEEVEAELTDNQFSITVDPHDMYDVVAGFIGDEYTLTVDADGAEIAFDPELTPNEDGTYTVHYGDEYTITAAAATGYTFEEVYYVNTTTGDVGNIIANDDGSYTLVIDGDITLGVKTKAIKYALTVEGDENVVADSTITLTAVLEPELEGDVITWAVSDESIATIDENGVLTGKSVGKVTVTATSATGLTAVKEDIRVLFKDVTLDDKDSYWFEPIYWGADNGFVMGIADKDGDYTTFNPTGVTNRGAMVTFLWRMAGEPEPKATVSPFSDVKLNKDGSKPYYYDAVLWAAENGIAAGYTDGTFKPTGPCLRRQACMFLWRLAGEPEVDTSENPFSDVSGIWVEPIVWASQNGITTGAGNGKFNSAGECMRRMILTFMYRFDQNCEINY